MDVKAWPAFAMIDQFVKGFTSEVEDLLYFIDCSCICKLYPEDISFSICISVFHVV